MSYRPVQFFGTQYANMTTSITTTANTTVTAVTPTIKELARRPRPGVLQAGSVSSSVSERSRTTVPVGLLRPGRQCCHLEASAFCQLLAVPRYCLNTYGRRAFSVAGPTVWNSLSAECFRRLLKMYLFARY